MKNVIISMVAKISKMDAEAKQLTARVEAQSLLLSALILTLGKNGGVHEIVENVKKAINTAIDSADSPLKSDAEMLLSEFTDLLSVTQLLDEAEGEIDYSSLNMLLSGNDTKDVH
ncbi:anti-adapter protein IraP [Metakosakonia massiliensis]|uniref:Anti-RssB factor n=1 Tax=Phytobacter massiliensis TaxID=1485952 RepID=A0A6N3HA78_9ENTR|nr:anti-adapter protein IraP [Phytobacter massiliensis]